jgi:hypothetical protein
MTFDSQKAERCEPQDEHLKWYFTSSVSGFYTQMDQTGAIYIRSVFVRQKISLDIINLIRAGTVLLISLKAVVYAVYWHHGSIYPREYVPAV